MMGKDVEGCKRGAAEDACIMLYNKRDVGAAGLLKYMYTLYNTKATITMTLKN